MPSNRTTIQRPQRAQISAEALALFLELEHLPQDSERFKDGSRRLARLLGLTREFWGGNFVNDKSSRPCWPPSLVAHDNWFRVRAVRNALLAAAGLEGASPRSETRAKRYVSPLA
jgi:hypothetical protein